jgi:TetR/AcrR family transcriptional repressor of nem operon
MARTREFDTAKAVDAAMTAFRNRGYEGTSVEDLVEATGVGRGSLYAAFGSKDSLYLAAVDLYRERYAVPLVASLQGGTVVRELIREVFVGVVDEILGAGQRLACLVVSASMERARHDPAVARQLQDTIGSIEQAFFEVIVRAQSDGQLPDRRSALDLARFLVMSLQGLRVIGAVTPDRRVLMSSVDVILSCLD